MGFYKAPIDDAFGLKKLKRADDTPAPFIICSFPSVDFLLQLFVHILLSYISTTYSKWPLLP